MKWLVQKERGEFSTDGGDCTRGTRDGVDWRGDFVSEGVGGSCGGVESESSGASGCCKQ